MGSAATKHTILGALMTTITLVFAPTAGAEETTSLTTSGQVSTIGCVGFDDGWPFVTIDCLPPNAGSARPEAPWGLAAVPMADESSTVLLTWQAPLDDGGSPVFEYNVYRSTDGAPAIQIGTADGTAFADAVPEQGNEVVELVSYYVTAVNEDGESQPSASASSARVSTMSCVDLDDEWPFIWIDPDCIPP